MLRNHITHIMLAAVQFNNRLTRRAVKVHDIVSKVFRR